MSMWNEEGVRGQSGSKKARDQESKERANSSFLLFCFCFCFFLKRSEMIGLSPLRLWRERESIEIRLGTW